MKAFSMAVMGAEPPVMEVAGVRMATPLLMIRTVAAAVAATVVLAGWAVTPGTLAQ